MKWRIRGERRGEGGREREKDFSMPSARASHLSSPYSSFIHSVIFPLWVIYGLVSCLCTLGHLTVTCVPLQRLQRNAAKQRPTAAPTARLSQVQLLKLTCYFFQGPTQVCTSRGQCVKHWFHLTFGLCKDLLPFPLKGSWVNIRTLLTLEAT